MGESVLALLTLPLLQCTFGLLPPFARLLEPPQLAVCGTFELARVMGTSLEMIEPTYGHLMRGADDVLRSRLDACAASRGEKEPVGSVSR